MTTQPVQVTPLPLEDYEAIEAAVMETQRGRWFLTEYARRNRNCDTDAVLTSLERIERNIRRDRAAPDIDRIRLDLADMAEAISRTKQEISQMKVEAEEGGRFAEASQELDAIVEQTEAATNDILLAAENIQEVAWTLREAGAAEELCEKLDGHATDVYTACSFQDLTGQRTRKVVTVLRYLESRINAMIDIWGMHDDDHEAVASAMDDAPFDPMDARPDAHLLNGPQLQGRGVEQSDVDELMWADFTAETDFAPEPGFDGRETASTSGPAERLEDAPLTFDDVDLAAADVFATQPDVAPAKADVFAAADEDDLVDMAPAVRTVVVGNTLATVTAQAVAVEDAAPELSLVRDVDPIAALSPEARLITFG